MHASSESVQYLEYEHSEASGVMIVSDDNGKMYHTVNLMQGQGRSTLWVSTADDYALTDQAREYPTSADWMAVTLASRTHGGRWIAPRGGFRGADHDRLGSESPRLVLTCETESNQG